MTPVLSQPGVLRVVAPAVLERALQSQAEHKAQAARGALETDDLTLSNLARHIETRFSAMRTHRSSQSGWANRLLAAMRAYNGEYPPDKLAQIKQFGGSEVYARIVAMKCRGASSLLRDVYLQPDRPWGLDPPADPDVPQHIVQSISQLVQSEVGALEAAGAAANDVNIIRDRVMQLMDAAKHAARKLAAKQAQMSEDKIQELLDEGGFYKALAEFLVDLPLFPFACLKGPVVRIVPTVVWEGGRAVIRQSPRLFWNRVSPFDLYWTPGVSDIEDAEVIERGRMTRGELNDLLDLPGYNHDTIRKVLEDYGRGGLFDNWDTTDSERAVLESRENPQQNQSGMISYHEYHGNVQGLMLLEYGMNPQLIDDPLRDYMVQAWKIGRYIIKVQLTPSPRKRHPYFITSFEKVPGTVVGNGLPDILSDIADVVNATLRALVNNMSIASGPQVVINTDLMHPDEDAEALYPWKRWRMLRDPMGNNTQVPVSFFQPNSNAQELLSVYQALTAMADEVSGIPKYQTGSGATGGAGRTAAGLAMLMGNASKINQTVAANIDRDVIAPALTNLFDLLMLTDDTGLLTGQETIRVMGVAVAVQRETQRARQLEFLQLTANPIDMQIMGVNGRAKVLSKVADGIGLDGENIVPSEQDLAAAAAFPPPGAPGSPAAPNMDDAAAKAQGTQQSSAVTKDMGPRLRIGGGVG